MFPGFSEKEVFSLVRNDNDIPPKAFRAKMLGKYGEMSDGCTRLESLLYVLRLDK